MKIYTIYGLIEERELRRKAWVEEDDVKQNAIVEYYLAGKLVHRSAHITLKQGIGIESHLGAF